MWPDPQIPADLVTFTEEILNRKLHFFVQCKMALLTELERFYEEIPSISAKHSQSQAKAVT